jgi:hypothetical protein
VQTLLDERLQDIDQLTAQSQASAADKQAWLVVIELKRTLDGGHMELQAIRYASMVSAMTFERAELGL